MRLDSKEEPYSKEEPSIVVFGIDAYRTSALVNGYTDNSDDDIFINLHNCRRSPSRETFYMLCKTIAHELMHCFNYKHSPGGAWEANSVPYVVGDLVAEILLTTP